MEKKMTFEQVVKENPGFEWKDISDRNRTYVFPPKDGLSNILTIEDTVAITINHKSGGHRIVDGAGRGWYIAPNWIAIWWVSTDGSPVFRF